jgi:hypothetical protein
MYYKKSSNNAINPTKNTCELPVSQLNRARELVF